MRPHAADIDSLARELASDRRAGLTEAEAARRLARDGPNRLGRPTRPHYGRILLRQLADPLVALLIAAVVVSAAIGNTVEAGAIGIIVVLNAVLGFTQEARAQRAVHALREALPSLASVVRASRERALPAEEVVRGDLVVLREGERVPADGRIVHARGIAVDESILTGESVPVDKEPAPVPEGSSLGDRTSMVYAGTWVTRGRGAALVTATGEATEEGKIVGLTSEAKPPTTPLQERLGTLARIMVLLGIGITVVIAVGMILRDASAEEAFLVGVSVAVAAVPEGLAATVTIALALGARAMALRGAIVQRLAAVETLGATTVVCTDKTGTLTENRLHVAAVVPEPGVETSAVLTAAVLASSARIVGDGEQERVAGDPLEAALVLAARAQGIDPGRARAGLRLVHEIPFESERRRMTVEYENAEGRYVAVKGAPEALIARSRLAPAERARLEALARSLAEQGARVLAVAERRLGPSERPSDEDVDRDLTPLGLVALHDPLRPQAAPAVAEARRAGVDVAMLTGDHPATAHAIARELELPAAAVYARIEPTEKLEIVTGLQQTGQVVAVTGDGINDAPALRRADVGVAMGRSGTQAAREASDLVLTDDDFATIIAAIEEGRRISDNVRKFVTFLLSANLGEVALFAVAVLGGLGVPMTVVQVLAVNVLTDGLPAVALSRDPASPETMRRRPRARAALFSRERWAVLGVVGLLVGAAALAAFLIGRELGGGVAQTMAFASVALGELALVFTLRSTRAPAWREPHNPYLSAAVVLSAVLVVLMLYVPALNEAFATVPLSGSEMGIVLGLALLPALLVELGKAVFRRTPYDSGEEPGRGS